MPIYALFFLFSNLVSSQVEICQIWPWFETLLMQQNFAKILYLEGLDHKI